MKINTSTIIKWYDGSDIMPGFEKPFTVKAVMKSTCTGMLESDATMNKMDKLNLDVLAHRFYSCKDEVDLASEEIVMLKARIEKMFMPRIVGAMNSILEGQSDIIENHENHEKCT
jgi:hypothetical protein